MSLKPNSRFTNIGSGIVAEMISDSVQITYNPTDQRCRVLFTGHNFIKPGEKYLPIGMGSDILDVDLTPYMTSRPVPESFGLFDPVTGVNLSNISIAGMVYFIKFIYDFFHNKRADDIAKLTPGMEMPASRPPNSDPATLPQLSADL